MRAAYEAGFNVITLTDCCAATRWGLQAEAACDTCRSCRPFPLMLCKDIVTSSTSVRQCRSSRIQFTYFEGIPSKMSTLESSSPAAVCR